MTAPFVWSRPPVKLMAVDVLPTTLVVLMQRLVEQEVVVHIVPFARTPPLIERVGFTPVPAKVEPPTLKNSPPVIEIWLASKLALLLMTVPAVSVKAPERVKPPPVLVTVPLVVKLGAMFVNAPSVRVPSGCTVIAESGERELVP